jgi:hypothetical protein
MRRGSATGGGIMQTVAISLKRAMVALALVLPTGLVAAGVAAAPPAAATICTDESLVWAGVAHLDAQHPVVDTGLRVSAGSGVTLDVVGVSADGLDASRRAVPLPVTIGGMPAVAGARVVGGMIEVHSAGDVDRHVMGATVLLRRCVKVDSLASDDRAPSANSNGTVATGAGQAALQGARRGGTTA